MVATFGLRHRSPQSLAVVSMFACGLLSGYDSSLAFSYPELQMLLTFRDFDEVLLVVLRPSVTASSVLSSSRAVALEPRNKRAPSASRTVSSSAGVAASLNVREPAVGSVAMRTPPPAGACGWSVKLRISITAFSVTVSMTYSSSSRGRSVRLDNPERPALLAAPSVPTLHVVGSSVKRDASRHHPPPQELAQMFESVRGNGM